MRLRNQFVIAAQNFAWGQSLSPVLIPTMSKDMDEQLKLAHKEVDVVDRPCRKICASLLLYTMDNLETYSQIWFSCKQDGGRENSTNCLCEL